MDFHKKEWIDEYLSGHRRGIIPIIASTGVKLCGKSMDAVYGNPIQQVECLRQVQERWKADFAVAFMDLSLEAEAFGANVAFSATEIPNVTGTLINDEDEIDALAVPGISTPRLLQTLDCLKECAGSFKAPVLCGMIGPYTLAGRLADMSEFMMMALSEPDTAHCLLEKVTMFLVNYAQALKATGVAGVMIAEPAAGLVSPQMCGEFSSAYLKQIVDAVSDDSFITILHNCGRSDKMLPEMLASGVDAIHVGNSVSMAGILDALPENILGMGNIDPVGVLRQSSSTQVYDTTAALLNATASYRNFVLSTGCDIPSDVPPQNLDAFFQALKDFNSAR